MIPHSGRRYLVNRAAVFSQMTDPLSDDDAQVPTVIWGGVRLSAYVDSEGVVKVSVCTDEDEIDPAIARVKGDAIAMEITVNDTTVYVA